jgi:hypothetical protein
MSSSSDTFASDTFAAADFPFDRFARLVRQAHLEGASYETLRLIVEEAAHHGAARALLHCGLEDSAAGRDISDLRQLLEAWRDVKRTARAALVRWITFGVLAVMMAGLALKFRHFNVP